MGPPLNLMMLLRCLTSSVSDDGSWECSGGLYRPDRSMEIAAEGGVVLTSLSSKCSTEVPLRDWEVDAGEEEY